MMSLSIFKKITLVLKYSTYGADSVYTELDRLITAKNYPQIEFLCKFIAKADSLNTRQDNILGVINLNKIDDITNELIKTDPIAAKILILNIPYKKSYYYERFLKNAIFQCQDELFMATLPVILEKIKNKEIVSHSEYPHQIEKNIINESGAGFLYNSNIKILSFLIDNYEYKYGNDVFDHAISFSNNIFPREIDMVKYIIKRENFNIDVFLNNTDPGRAEEVMEIYQRMLSEYESSLISADISSVGPSRNSKTIKHI